MKYLEPALNNMNKTGMMDLFEVEDEYMVKFSTLFHLNSTFNFTSNNSISVGDFYFQSFESQEIIEDYIKHPDYGLVEDRPGICFAFDIHQKAEQKFDVTFMQQDRSGLAKSTSDLDEEQFNESYGNIVPGWIR